MSVWNREREREREGERKRKSLWNKEMLLGLVPLILS